MTARFAREAAAAAAFILFGCASVQEFAMTPEERAQQDQRAAEKCSATSDNRTWDLGTGRALEVRRIAPGFWALRDEGWAPSNQPLAIADQDREAADLRKVNRLRVESLDLAKGISRQAARVGDMDVVDLVPDGGVPYQFRAITNDDKTIGILATAGECPHVVAHSTCENQTLRTDVRVEGTLRCVGPYSVSSDYVEINSDASARHTRLPFGEMLNTPPDRGSLTFTIFAPGSKFELATVTRQIDDLTDPVPEEVLATLRAGREPVAAKLYQTLADSFRTANFEKNIVELRVTRANTVSDRPAAITKYMAGLSLGSLPGDKEVSEVLARQLSGLAAADPSAANLELAATIGKTCTDHGVQRPDLSAMEAKYGPLLTTSLYGNEKAEAAFYQLFPDSHFNHDVMAMHTQEMVQRRNADAEAQDHADLDQLWEDVRSQGDSLAELTFKIAFAEKTFDQRRARRGILNMRAGREMVVRNGYCPAKKAFVTRAGTSEFSKRATQHCKDEPPTSTGLAGAEITLTRECRVVFATGC